MRMNDLATLADAIRVLKDYQQGFASALLQEVFDRIALGKLKRKVNASD